MTEKVEWGFKGEVIKLTKEDYSRWVGAFPNVNLSVVLPKLDEDLFEAVSNWYENTAKKLKRMNTIND